MCGRYAIAPSRKDAWATMGDQLGPQIEQMLAALEPQFNIAPTTQIPIIRQNPATRAIEPLIARWGFIPHWWKDVKAPTFSINARQEEAAIKPMWRDAWLQRRCLIPATHWYEWRQDPAGKQPFSLRMAEGEGFCFAGLYSRWTPPGSDAAIYTAAIVTRPAAPALAHIHDRMPVILHPLAWRDWLDPDRRSAELVEQVLVIHAVMEAKTERISTRINSARNQGADVLDPLADEA
jgi:putative SOS response-associated peptidase YedK